MLVRRIHVFLAFNDDNVAQTRDVMDLATPTTTHPLMSDHLTQIVLGLLENNLDRVSKTDWSDTRFCKDLLPPTLSQAYSKA